MSDTKTNGNGAKAKPAADKPFPGKADLQADKTQPQNDAQSGEGTAQATEQTAGDGANTSGTETQQGTTANQPGEDQANRARITNEEDLTRDAQERNAATAEHHTSAAVDAGAGPAPQRELRPGEPGYAPPARVAHFTTTNGGVLTNEHLGYNPGVDPTLNTSGQVPLAMPAPAAPGATAAADSIRPSLLTKASATVVAAKMTGDFQAWIMDMPHTLEGKLGVVAQFFRDLAAREAALSTAHQLGRTVGPDAVDKTSSGAPAEYFQLRNAAAEIVTMHQIYDAMLKSKGLELSADDQRSVNQILSHFEGMADGPKSPSEVIGAEEDRAAA